MKSLFEETARQEILNRIDLVKPETKRQWGKMTSAQMLCHCAHALDMAMGTINPERIFMGRILGPIFKKKYSDDSAFGKSSPTSNELVTLGTTPQFDKEKTRLKNLVYQFSINGDEGVTKYPHPFFGLLTPAEWGKGMYKHLDHHLKQFSS